MWCIRKDPTRHLLLFCQWKKKSKIHKQLQGRNKKKGEKCTNTHMITPTNQSTTYTFYIYGSIFPFSRCFASFTVFFANFNRYFRYSKYTNEELRVCMWKNSFTYGNTGTAEILTYSTMLIKILKILLDPTWGNAKMHRSMRG